MSSRVPPRYLPTLTEVVDPSSLVVWPEPVVAIAPEAAQPVDPTSEPAATEPTAQTVHAPLPTSVPPDKQALAQQLIKLVRPQLEAELRTIAQELFEAQFSALLPSMHMHIEEAVREAIEQALPDPPDISL